MYILLCATVFLAAYLINATMISVFYHRGLAHQAVTLRPWTRRMVGRFGVWITGLDPVGWGRSNLDREGWIGRRGLDRRRAASDMIREDLSPQRRARLETEAGLAVAGGSRWSLVSYWICLGGCSEAR